MQVMQVVIMGLQKKRCQGFDRIPLVFYVDGAEVLLDIITILMKKIIEDGNVPDQWKVAKVIPIMKKGKSTLVENYRPISNLCSITKILERLILNRIKCIEKIEGCDLSGNHQFGFKTGLSTESACLKLQSQIAEHCDAGEFVAVATLDMSAAFDTVDHLLLTKRLKKMGMPKNLLIVIDSWLSDRFFYCEINGRVSRFTKIKAGTVQGSILGPILYSLFTSQLADLVKYLVTFADDNYQIGTAATEAGAIEDCVSSLNIVITFLRDSGLHINNSKTEVCIFHGRDTCINTVIIDGRLIQVSKVMRILGVYFDSKLTWFSHVSNAINSANKAKQALCIISRYFSSDELLKLSTAYFYSRLYYGAKVWLHSGLNGLLKKKLWQASSRMLQVVDKDYQRRKSFNDLHKLYKRASPLMWSNYTTTISMYNVIHMLFTCE